MPKPILLIDLDECLFPYATNYIPWLKRYRNIDRAFPDPHGEYDHFDSDLWHPELDAVFINHPDALLANPLPEALDATVALSQKYSLVICTARIASSHEKSTLDWVGRHLPHFDDTIFTYVAFGKPGITKGKVAEQLDAVGLIDDRQMHLDTLLPTRKAFLVSRGDPIPSDAGALSWTMITEELLG